VVTNKTDDKFADLYEIRWVPVLIPTLFVLFANGAIGVAMGTAVAYMGVWTFHGINTQAVSLAGQEHYQFTKRGEMSTLLTPVRGRSRT
jgi:hypothetical protein